MQPLLSDELPRRRGSRLAFFGGSFDPPHLGHLAIARAARDAFHLDTVLFAPVGTQPLKPEGSAASFEDRLAMTRLAIEGEPGFAISLADAPKPSESHKAVPNYTIDALEKLSADARAEFRPLLPDGRRLVLRPASLASRRGDPLRGDADRCLAARAIARKLREALPQGLELEPAPGGDKIESGIEVRAFLLVNSAAIARLSMCCQAWMSRSARRRSGPASPDRRRAAFLTGGEVAPSTAGCGLHPHPQPLFLTFIPWPLFPIPQPLHYHGLGEPFRRMNISPAQKQTRILVQAAAAVCEEKKGQHTRILELDPIDSGLADFFLVTSATNERQAVAIADEIELRLKRNFGVYPHSVEGRSNGEWILLDYVDFVIHVFLSERREFYDIERLRKSARPLTPAEFDAELKAALAEKTRAARKKAPAVRKPAKVPAKPASRVKPAKKQPAAKKAPARKAISAKKSAKKKRK